MSNKMTSNTTDNAAPSESGAPRWKKGQRVVGAARREAAAYVVHRYSEGASIRVIAAATGRSYGFVHRVLADSDIPLRPRGGPRRRRDRTAPAAGPGEASRS